MAQAAASSVNKEMEISMERLSTGKRINGASDDAAGVAIASRLTSEIRGTNQAIRNAMDGQAMIDTAEGAHNEITNILQRMREIAVQAANDTNDATDRKNLAVEMTQLATEIDRIAEVTSWAGKSLLNGTSGTGSTSFNIHVGSGTGAADTIAQSISSMRSASLSVAGDTTVALTGAATGATIASSDSLEASVTIATAAASADYGVTIDGVAITLTGVTTGDTGTALAALLVTEINNNAELDNITASVATNSGKITFVKAETHDLSSTTAASTMITTLDTAISAVNTQRAKLGSTSNRLDNVVSNLTNISANLQAGRGRIEDADFAAETTSLAKSQILQQASTAMLAQANASKQNVLSLLQG